jgi:hypothetical protein
MNCCLMFFFCTGKLAKVSGVVVSRRITKTAKNTLTPFYGVKIGTSSQVIFWNVGFCSRACFC